MKGDLPILNRNTMMMTLRGWYKNVLVRAHDYRSYEFPN